MFTEKDILARLQNGEDAQTIANEMADMINKANKMYVDEKAAEEAKKVAAEKATLQKKKEELQEIIDLFCDWTCDYLGMSREEFGEITADQVIELIDSLKGYVDAVKNFELFLDGKKPAIAPGRKIVKAESADETINKFLKSMGW